MMNPIQAVPYQCGQQQCTVQQCNIPQQQATSINPAKEQSMAVSIEIAAEYNAIASLNDSLVKLCQEAKEEKNPERKALLESRIKTLNNMINQREEKINQMHMVKKQLDCQAIQ